MADYTTIQDSAAIISGGVIEASHSLNNFNAIISAFADRLDTTSPDPASITGKVTFAGGVGGSPVFDGGLTVALLSFFAQGVRLGALVSSVDGDLGYNTTIDMFEAYAAGAKKAIVTPRLGMTSNLAPVWQNASVVRIPAGYWQPTVTGELIEVASNLDVNLASTGALGREAGTASEANNTWYYLWLCRGASGVTAVWSNSAVSITAPTGYADTTSLVNAAFRNNSSSDLLEVRYVGSGLWRYMTNKYVVGGATPATEVLGSTVSGTFTTVSLADFVPPLSTSGNLTVYTSGTSNPLSLRQVGSSLTVGDASVSCAQFYSGLIPFFTNSSQEVQYKTGSTNWQIAVDSYRI